MQRSGKANLLAMRNDTSFSYNAAHELTSLYNLKSNASVISSFDYGYDDAGNRTRVEEASGDRVTWVYDDTNQLIAERRSGTNAYANTFTYDSVGNRLVNNTDNARTTSTFDAANQLEKSIAVGGRTTYVFDEDGNQQVTIEPSGDRTTNVWDYENQTTEVQLPSGSRETMAYNADNRRIQKKES